MNEWMNKSDKNHSLKPLYSRSQADGSPALCYRRHRSPMGMVQLRPLTESKPLNQLWQNFAQLIKCTRRICNQKFVPIYSKGASGEIREIYSLLFYFLFFSRTRLLKWPVDGFWCTMAQNALWRKEVLFRGSHDGRQYSAVQISQKPSKWPSIGMFDMPQMDSRWMTS